MQELFPRKGRQGRREALGLVRSSPAWSWEHRGPVAADKLVDVLHVVRDEDGGHGNLDRAKEGALLTAPSHMLPSAVKDKGGSFWIDLRPNP